MKIGDVEVKSFSNGVMEGFVIIVGPFESTYWKLNKNFSDLGQLVSCIREYDEKVCYLLTSPLTFRAIEDYLNKNLESNKVLARIEAAEKELAAAKKELERLN